VAGEKEGKGSREMGASCCCDQPIVLLRWIGFAIRQLKRPTPTLLTFFDLFFHRSTTTPYFSAKLGANRSPSRY
jgi:hypothetical protein